MSKLVRKRNDSVVAYSKENITQAINKALQASDTQYDAKIIADQIETALQFKFFKRRYIPTVEQIQDCIEETLILRGLTQAAKSYILYREKRTEARENLSIFEEADCLVSDYIDKQDWRVNENSNMDYSLQGLNYYLSSAISAKYWLSKIYTQKIKDYQRNGEMHIHDLGILGPYCVGWDLMDLLKGGFVGVEGKIASSPANHLRTAFGQIVNFFYTLQGEAAGAQAFSNFDTLLAPFIYYDKLSYAEVKQCMQEFLFSINIPTRVGFQTPFTNVTLDLKVPKSHKDLDVIVGGVPKDKKYSEFQTEMNMFNRAFSEVMMKGDVNGRIFTFPIPTYNITKDFDWEDDTLQPLWEMTGKYGIPYFSNFVNSDMQPEDARSMCCRLRLDQRELKVRGGGLFGSNPLTGSIGVVTINMPRIALLAEENSEKFYAELTSVMLAAKESLELKRKFIETLTERGMYPYTKYYLRDVKACGGKYWANHFGTIGLIGMNEAVLNFMQKDILDVDGRNWVVEVLTFMRNKLLEFQVETSNLYNLEASPAEGASYKLAKQDVIEFPKANHQGESNPYYTNSVHVPVKYQMDAFSLLQHQDELQVLFTGGTVVHLFIGEAIPDWKMVRELVKRIVNKFKLPYFSITPTFSICPVHGYLSGEHFYCSFPHTDEELIKYGKEVVLKDTIGLKECSYKEIKFGIEEKNE